MDDKVKWIIIGVSALVIALIITIMIINSSRKKLKKEVDALFVRFNQVKTLPIAFKLSQAKVKAKNSESDLEKIDEYSNKYSQVEQNINSLQNSLDDLDDLLNIKDYKQVKVNIDIVEQLIVDIEKDINEIDEYLNSFEKKDDEQREYSSNLKQEYLMIKNTINDNSSFLSLSYDGFINRLEKCEELFSSSEEYMFSNDYINAQNDLEKIEKELEQIKLDANAMPKCIKEVKGVLPAMLDEIKRELALTRQRGVYLDHLNIDGKINDIENILNEDNKLISQGISEGVRENCVNSKQIINNLNDALQEENKAFKQVKDTLDKIIEHISNLIKVENYVRVAYDKDSNRFGLQDLKPILKKQRETIEKYKLEYKELCDNVSLVDTPASVLLDKADNLCSRIEEDNKELYSYKTIIDKSTDGETRANTQLLKLQLVVAEVESKIKQYHIPKISDSYNDDLKTSREYIFELKNLVSEVPINIDELNAKLDEAIDFIYKFYNNVNNIVGVAIMVENAIVFGNRYRSTYIEIDHELSKAEFQYLNGEYTKALKTAIACMETLFPNNVDERIMENV